MLTLLRLFAPLARPAPRRRPTLAALVALRRSRAQLGHLDDHLLRDIGLTAQEAKEETDRPLWDAPRHWYK